jgi:hypothetical protein
MADENIRVQLKAQGRAEFEKAHFQAFWEEALELLGNKSVGLLNFDEVKAKLHLTDQAYRGLHEIPLDRIVGSVGRNREFTRHFLPKNAGLAERWSNVYAQINSMEGVPPIDVFKVDDVYFVRDGNHRVSIARQLKMDTIEAYVTEMQTPVNLAPDMTHREMASAEAYAAFLEETQLDRTRPRQDAIILTESHQYHNMREHIRLVQQVVQARRGEKGVSVTYSEAARIWYDTVYTPTINLIRKYNVLEQFPKRTEADLYIWIIGHFLRIWETYGDDASQLRLSNAMVDFLAENKIPIPKRLIVEDDEPLI